MGATSSGQGTAGGQGDGGGDAGQQQGGEGAGAGPDFGAMQSTLQQLSEGQESMREFLQSAPWQDIQQADPSQTDDGALPDLDLGYLDPDVAASMDPQQLQQMLGQTIQQQAEAVAQKMLDARINPLQEQIAEQQHTQEVNALVGEFPELAEADTAQQVLGAAKQLAEQMAPSLAQALGQPQRAAEIAQALANSPAHWRTTYMAGRAADAAREESGDVPSPVSLESGAGATPGGGGGDLGDQIIGAHRGSSVLPF